MGNPPFCTVRRTRRCNCHRRQQDRAAEGEFGDMRRGTFAGRNCGDNQWCLAIGQRESSMGLCCAADVHAYKHVREHDTRGYRSQDLRMIRQQSRAFGALFLLATCGQIPAMEPRLKSSGPGRASPRLSFESAIMKNFNFPATSCSCAVYLTQSPSADQNGVQYEECHQSAHDSHNHAE